MRQIGLLIAAVAALTPLAAHANDPAVIVEEAWISMQGDSASEAYLVISNRGADFAGLGGFASPLASTVRLLNARDRELPSGMTIPTHAELYMMPNGIRLALSDLNWRPSVGEKVPVTFRVAEGEEITALATVLPSGTKPPDHHDYVHD